MCWLKAIGGNRRGSGCEDDGLAYSLLPPVTRRVVGRPLCYLYPPLHHQNIAMRTAFLDRAVRAELARGEGASTVVVLGAGFDMRPWRLMEAAPAGSVMRPPHSRRGGSSGTTPSAAAAVGAPLTAISVASSAAAVSSHTSHALSAPTPASAARSQRRRGPRWRAAAARPSVP